MIGNYNQLRASLLNNDSFTMKTLDHSTPLISYEQTIDNTSANGKLLDDPSIHQLALLDMEGATTIQGNYLDRLCELLTSDLNFHGYDTGYASHDFHAFPAKFPPQLPRKFIRHLTAPGDMVLDPMMGSGTTVVEAYLADRFAIGFDIDPLALRIAKTKTTALSAETIIAMGNQIVSNTTKAIQLEPERLQTCLQERWDKETKKFIDYWFALETQIELLALLQEIQKISDEDIRTFFELVFSASIITKSGGVSLAFDLAHTRPHRAKIVYSQSGSILIGEEIKDDVSPRTQFLTKKLRSAPVEFHKRFLQNSQSLIEIQRETITPQLKAGNAQLLPLAAESVDLIVTSPPYASNAIDYMRAHKFSLVWLGHSISELTNARNTCIGGENTTDFAYEKLPPYTQNIVDTITTLDRKKGRVLHRYYSEMTRVLKEMYRVLKQERAAIVVVATSIMRDTDTETQTCLAEIGKTFGFEVPKIGVRHLDRNRRMMPAGMEINRGSQIQQRMHEEFVIGFYKP